MYSPIVENFRSSDTKREVSGTMAHPFYPFVENDGHGTPESSGQPGPSPSVVRYAARIAVYDDASAAPRVVVVDPADVRSYLEEITSQVTQLSHEQGGNIPFMVIREVVENFIHAYFIEPTITILDHGNTIRFSDQGPGIREKDRALEYGTTSATDEMKRYIRGVGSGLPYAQQYMVDKGGSLTIEDNISKGTVVTISTHPASNDNVRPHSADVGAVQELFAQSPAPVSQPVSPWGQAAPAQWQQPWPTPTASPYPTYGEYAPYGVPYAQQPPDPYQQRHMAAVQPRALGDETATGDQFSWVRLSVRGRAVLDYLSSHEAVGPTELARTYGESQPTWTRELKQLEEDGLLKKDGQKRRLTRMGQAYLESLS